MLAVVRLRGSIKVRKDIEDTLDMLGLKRKNTLSILPDSKEMLGMIRKVEGFVAWGTLSEDMLQKFHGKKTARLKAPKGGLRSVKLAYPRGDAGYNGDAINDLIRKMM